jgi:hypothetical protein
MWLLLALALQHRLIPSVADPDSFDADPDKTTEKNRIRIRPLKKPDPDPIIQYFSTLKRLMKCQFCGLGSGSAGSGIKKFQMRIRIRPNHEDPCGSRSAKLHIPSYLYM